MFYFMNYVVHGHENYGAEIIEDYEHSLRKQLYDLIPDDFLFSYDDEDAWYDKSDLKCFFVGTEIETPEELNTLKKYFPDKIYLFLVKDVCEFLISSSDYETEKFEDVYKTYEQLHSINFIEDFGE